jgi:hypothetical protein
MLPRPLHLLAICCLGACTLACNRTHNDVRPPPTDEAVGGDDAAPAIDLQGFNNGVSLSGASFPGGTDNVDDLHRIVPVSESTDNPELEVTTAVIARMSVTSALAAYAIVPVKNVGSRPYCFVTVRSVNYLGLGDTVLGQTSMRKVMGSVGRDAGAFTATCLAPQETGFFCDQVVGDVYESIVRLALELGESQDVSLQDPEAKLTPTAYNYDTTNGLTLALANTGTRAARLADGASLYLLLASDDTPLWFRALATPAAPGDLVVAASGSATLSDPTVAYNGTSGRILVFFDFADD